MPTQDTGSDYGTSTWVPSGFAGWGNELNSAAAAWGGAISGDFYQNAANSMGSTVVSPSGQTYYPTNAGQNAVVTSEVTGADPEFPWFIYDNSSMYGDDGSSPAADLGQLIEANAGSALSLPGWGDLPWIPLLGSATSFIEQYTKNQQALEGLDELWQAVVDQTQSWSWAWEDNTDEVLPYITGTGFQGAGKYLGYAGAVMMFLDPVSTNVDSQTGAFVDDSYSPPLGP